MLQFCEMILLWLGMVLQSFSRFEGGILGFWSTYLWWKYVSLLYLWLISLKLKCHCLFSNPIQPDGLMEEISRVDYVDIVCNLRWRRFFFLESCMCLKMFSLWFEMLFSLRREISGYRKIQEIVFSMLSLSIMFSFLFLFVSYGREYDSSPYQR